MRLSQLFTQTSREVSKEDVSRNAQLLTRAGFIDRLMAGVYNFLPLGLRVLSKIENIIREEMNRVGGQEILMPALQPREIWEQTGRWSKVDVLFKLKGAGERDLALGPTHEEVVTPLVAGFVQSYRKLPVAVYQIQTKFRNEPRAKSGLLRGREFRMKDLYSFHASQDCLDRYYERVTEAYHAVYRRSGIGDMTLLTYSSGGIFSRYSHEFQTITPYGEDVVYKIPGTNIAINKEIMGDMEALRGIIPNYSPGDENKLEECKAIEVGNIFKLGTRFSDSCNAVFTDENGKQQKMIMGCYGMGPSRMMGTVAECLSDDRGLVWPKEIAPFDVQLVSLCRDPADVAKSHEFYDKLSQAGVAVLYDEREGLQAGEKLNDADLIGIPVRVLISSKSLAKGVVEYKLRTSEQTEFVEIDRAIQRLAPRSAGCS